MKNAITKMYSLWHEWVFFLFIYLSLWSNFLGFHLANGLNHFGNLASPTFDADEDVLKLDAFVFRTWRDELDDEHSPLGTAFDVSDDFFMPLQR